MADFGSCTLRHDYDNDKTRLVSMDVLEVKPMKRAKEQKCVEAGPFYCENSTKAYYDWKWWHGVEEERGLLSEAGDAKPRRNWEVTRLYMTYQLSLILLFLLPLYYCRWSWTTRIWNMDGVRELAMACSGAMLFFGQSSLEDDDY